MSLLWKAPETKKFADIFCEVFLILRNIYFAEPSRTYFHLKNGSFGP
jgi:hypothetical protein